MVSQPLLSLLGRYLSNMLLFVTQYKLYYITNHNSYQATLFCKKLLSHTIYIKEKDNKKATF